jgi:hypothetical protein
MLKIITPKENSLSQVTYQSRIDLLLGIIKYSQALPVTLEEQKMATFVLALADHSEENLLNKGDVYGGALIYQKNASSLPPTFRGLLATPDQENIWSGAISFFINSFNKDPLEKAPSAPTLEDEFQTFYKALLEKFIEFGHQNHIDFLYLTLPSREYHNTKTKGSWSYALEITPENSSDGLFHGLLSLKKQKERTPYPLKNLFSIVIGNLPRPHFAS